MVILDGVGDGEMVECTVKYTLTVIGCRLGSRVSDVAQSQAK
jgi:hypothetical protein